ncbi:MAG: TetR/AcrR family transcriptional regulator [Spirochaetes bacterium]|nr:TetR/AcrR family transcriptional regulator [Spirochaetota bacterium]
MGRPRGRSELLIKRRKEKIMISTYLTISEKGYSTITIKDIAERANFSRGLLFYYFDSKEHIFIETLKWVNERISKRLEKKLSNIMDPCEKMKIKLEDSFLSIKENRLFYLFYLDFLREGARDKIFYGPNKEFNNSAIEKIKRILDEGVKSGDFYDDLNIEDVAKVIKAIVDGLLIQWLFDEAENFFYYKNLAISNIGKLVIKNEEKLKNFLRINF